MIKKLSILRSYALMSRHLGAVGTPPARLPLLPKMILCRLLAGMDEVHFAYYGMHRKPLAACMDYLTKREMDVLERGVNQGNTDLLDDKIAYFRRARSNGVPTPDVLAIINPEKVSLPETEGMPQIHTVDDLRRMLASFPGRRLIMKLAAGSYGVSMMSLQLGDTIVDHTGQPRTIDEIFGACATTLSNTGSEQRHLASSRCYVVQPHLVPHQALRDVMPGAALGTFRVVTYIDRKGQVSIPFAFVKIPRVHSLNDNFHHGATGNFLCGVDLQSGRLMDAYGKTDRSHALIERITHHPDTGTRFSGFVAPQWDELKSVAIRAAKAFPEFRTVGWDVALTEQGITILEGNWHYDPDGPQITLDRGIKTEVRALFQT